MAFDWDEENTDHVRRHGVEPEETEAALLDPLRNPAPSYSTTERRWAVLGATEFGRILFVVFTRRGGRIRVITARGAVEVERRRYKRRRQV